MPTTWQWRNFSAAATWTSVGNGSASAEFAVPVGESLQRVLCFGGFGWTKIVTGTDGQRLQHQIAISGNFRVQVRPHGGQYELLHLEQFTFDRSGSWSSGSITDTNVAAAFVWHTPPNICDFDAAVRVKSTGDTSIRCTVFWVGTGMGTDGLISPDNNSQAFGAVEMRVLTSSVS